MNDETSLADDQIALTTAIVAAYVSHNAINAGDLPALIGQVHAALTGLGKTEAPQEVALAPAVPIRKSVTPDYIVCLEDGKKFKSLKRHLATHFQLTPEEYRSKWSLPTDYPMVAPSYAATRSALAKANGLGRKKEEPAPASKRKQTSTK